MHDLPGNAPDALFSGDIGGTNTRLALFSFSEGTLRPLVTETYRSEQASGLEDLIELFLKKHPVKVLSACFGIAGPIEEGRVKTTNLPWEIFESRIRERFRWENVSLINDVEATIRAVPLLRGEDFLTLNEGEPRQGNLGMVAPGTGLGQALMFRVAGRNFPVATEGGHVEFAPRDERQIELWRYLHRKFGHVSVERVVSGPGLNEIYGFLRTTSGRPEPSWLSRRLEREDPPRVVTEIALGHGDPVCMEAAELFVSVLGAVSGNLALTGFTTGGIYLGGGIPPKMLPFLKTGVFMEAFTDKGRFTGFVSRIPVYVIVNDKAALIGAADCALKCLDSGSLSK
jgi:glucokinase